MLAAGKAVVETTTYDMRGRPVLQQDGTETNPAARVKSFTYLAGGQLLTAKAGDPTGTAWTGVSYIYGSLGRLRG